MNYKYTALTIETRKHKALEFVLNNICDSLSHDWKILLFHGINNKEYANEIVTRLNIKFNNRICLIGLNIDTFDLTEYSKFLSTKSVIYDYIDTEIFLIFQTDSIILKKYSHLIDEYLIYDYVGSPWSITGYIPTYNCNFIGNGGFSLRRKSKMLEIIEKIDWNNRYEDLYFSTNYEGIDVNKPTYEKAKMFCVDEVFNEITFACHKPWVHAHFNAFKQIFPESEELQNLQYIED
jgi:hypothetical protein